MANLDVAVRLVTQATNQDSAKNYEEAARCYREAIIGFQAVAKSRKISPQVRQVILEKCTLYEERLKKLDRYLLSKADLSKLFRDCVQQQVKQTSSSSSLYNIDCEVDSSAETILKQGQDLIDKAKRQDEKLNFVEALKNYEAGVELLLQAAHKTGAADPKSEAIRFKCLLIHERIENIRNHVEKGDSIFGRREVFDVPFRPTSRLKGFDSCSASPEPYIEESIEEQALLMEEIRSSKSRDSICSSLHSLYPTVCEIKESPVHGSLDDLTKVIRKQSHKELIPLVDMTSEMQISNQSLDALLPEGGHRTRYSSSGSRHSFHSSLNEVHLSFEDSYERDCNVTEVTYEYTGLDIETLKAYTSQSGSNDSGSDSGHGSSIKGGDITIRTPSNSPVSSHTNASPHHYADSDEGESLKDFVPTVTLTSAEVIASDVPDDRCKTEEVEMQCRTPLLNEMEPCLSVDVTPKKTSSDSSPATRASSLRRSTKRVDPAEADELRVVSTEVIGNPSTKQEVTAEPSVTTDATSARPRPEYVPPRALAYQHPDEEDAVSKGCFYFMACIDSFWIL